MSFLTSTYFTATLPLHIMWHLCQLWHTGTAPPWRHSRCCWLCSPGVPSGAGLETATQHFNQCAVASSCAGQL